MLVLDLEYEVQAYTTLGRLERAATLRAWLDQRKEWPTFNAGLSSG